MTVSKLIALAVVIAAAPARAACPTTADDPACLPWTAIALPTMFVAAYRPGDDSGWWTGAGVEASLLAWSDSSPAFGPSHGALRLDIGVLGSSQAGRGAMVIYRAGGEVSFERNPGRRFLIPYFALDLGGLWTRATGSRLLADAGLGVYLVHRRGLVVALEADAVLPFRDPGELGGVRAQLTGSVALW